MHYWNCYLDPLTMVAIIMSAGLGVDYTIHIIFHYLMENENYDKKLDRINNSFKKCGLSTLQV